MRPLGTVILVVAKQKTTPVNASNLNLNPFISINLCIYMQNIFMQYATPATINPFSLLSVLVVASAIHTLPGALYDMQKVFSNFQSVNSISEFPTTNNSFSAAD